MPVVEKSTTFSIKVTTVGENSGMYSGVNSLRAKLAGVLTRRMGELNPNDVSRKTQPTITSAGIRKILKGESDLKVETLVILAKAVGTTAPELLLEALDENSADVGNAKSQIEHGRLIEMYSDMPPQAQKTAMEMLAALHSNYGGRATGNDHANGPIRAATPLSQHENYVSGTADQATQKPDMPAKKQA